MPRKEEEGESEIEIYRKMQYKSDIKIEAFSFITKVGTCAEASTGI